MTNFENFDKALFKGEGKYGIPPIAPEFDLPADKEHFISMNYALSTKTRRNVSVHCFVDDYQFLRYWNDPNKYIPILQEFRSVLSPDFSLYTDMPMAMQIYNHFRKHWLAAYWQWKGIKVYPSIAWSSPESYEWCFDGEPHNSVVAVSSVGIMRDKEAYAIFMDGYNEMKRRLNPSGIIFYGKIPDECKEDNIFLIEPHYKSIRQRAEDNCKQQTSEV